MTDRISPTFATCREQGRAALVCFITGGDPTPNDTGAMLDALVAGGADLIELGMPFTDPMADGPAIQKQIYAVLARARQPPIFWKSLPPSASATRKCH